MGRLATDRKETVMIAECPNGCQGFTLETEGRAESVDELVDTALMAYDECRKCGAELSFVRQDEPTEVLE